MHIKRIYSDKSSFKEVRFEPGFNVVVAERTEGSTERDSRNGVGKSTLIEIIHYCFGSDHQKSSLSVQELKGWTFSADFEIGGKEYTVSRNTDSPDVVFLRGDFSDWTTQPVRDELYDAHVLAVDQWCEVLGVLAFGLPSSLGKFTPSFRSLIAYFARRGVEAFANPLAFFRRQPEWSIQGNNAYLLGLGYEYAAKFQVLKDAIEDIREIKKATGHGYFKDLIGSLGELEAERVTKTQEIDEFKGQLASFKVHPQYHKIQDQADELTRTMQELINSRHIEETLKKRYSGSLESERDISLDVVSTVYKEAGLNFADTVNKSLEDVSGFHTAILGNRRTYLQAEITRLTKSIEEKDKKINELSEKRSEVLSVLHSHGALEEHSRLSGRLAMLEGELEEVKRRIKNLKEFEARSTDLEIQKKDLLRLAKQDKEEKREIIDTAIAIFNESARALYESGGTLAIDITDNGYSFKPELQRGRSQGIGYMKVFCYDITLAQLQAKFFSKKFLVHDSTVFDGVDERQFARALSLAAEKAQQKGFQYICMLNSDVIPYSEFTDDFKTVFSQAIRLKLTDSAADGTLLGVRFD